MKTISKLAFALALTTGVSGLALTPPAFAKKKEEAAGPKLSQDFLKLAKPVQDAINAKDFATADAGLPAASAAAKNDDEKYVVAALTYDLANQKLAAQQAANPNAPINETSLAAPLDALLASPGTPAADKGKYAYRRGALAYNGKQWPVAIQYFNQAKQLGYTAPDLELQIAQAKVAGGDVTGGLADLEAQVQKDTAAGKQVPEDYYRYGIARANAAKLAPQTVSWIQKYVTAYPSAKTWRAAIVTYGLAGNSVVKLDEPQKIDLFRLMRATRSLADQNDYLEYADDVSRRGLPAEAAAVLKEGMAAGKVPATNALAKQIMADATNKMKLEGSLTPLEKRSAAAANGKLAASTADAYLGMDNFAKAIELYRLALQKGGVDADEVNTHLGIAMARSGDKAGAKAAFAEVKTSPRSGIAAMWSTYLDAPAVTA